MSQMVQWLYNFSYAAPTSRCDVGARNVCSFSFRTHTMRCLHDSPVLSKLINPFQLAISYPRITQEGGLLLVTPEHRLSLELKCQELWEQGPESTVETAVLDRLKALPYLDILDESDELLHPR